jgi:ferric-dicitrate binding protein FerR (iron transport regulator)
MGRARKQAVEEESEHASEAAAKPKRRRGRRTLFWVALLGAIAYALVRWQQQQVDLDEGVWHEAPES